MGGLGIINSRTFNQSLRLKCWWILFEERLKPWQKLTQNLHYQKTTNPTWNKKTWNLHLPFGTICWSCNTFSHKAPVVSNGKLIYFWHGQWNPDKHMKDIFPELFILSNKSEVSVVDFLRTTNLRSHFREILNSTATEKVVLLEILINKAILGNNPDSIKWKWHQSRKFTVKECYKFLRHGGTISRFAKFNWKIPLP